MYKLLIIALLTVIMHPASGQQVADPMAVQRSVAAFRQIKVSHGIELVLSQSDHHAVAVSASLEEYRNRIKTEVDNGVLKIYYDHETMKDWTSRGKNLKAYVSVTALDKLTATSGSTVRVEGVVKEDALALSFNSGASFRGKLEVGKLEAEVESGAAANIQGNAGYMKLRASTGSKLGAYELTAGKVDIRSTTGAKVEVMVKDEMKLYASTGGNIYYRGEARITDVNTELGAVIRKVN